jgi:hypothetical protein
MASLSETFLADRPALVSLLLSPLFNFASGPGLIGVFYQRCTARQSERTTAMMRAAIHTTQLPLLALVSLELLCKAYSHTKMLSFH